jgi:hypothetical protein
MGLLPQDFEHNICVPPNQATVLNPNDYIPNEIKHHFKQDTRESLEGDWMIVTSRSNTDTGKEALITEQLEELGLKEHTHVFYKDAEDSDDESKEIVLITVTVPDEIINKEA